jgi:hypothetical protein
MRRVEFAERSRKKRVGPKVPERVDAGIFAATRFNLHDRGVSQ